MNLKSLLSALLLSLLASAASAADPLVFNDPAMEIRYNDLTAELRCAVCQNQSLADSDAELAQDLRKEIYDMMMAGQDNEQIKTFMVDRYGDFVLYRPAMEGNTLLLWLMPGILLFIGAIAVFFTVRNRKHQLTADRQKGSN